MPVKKYELTHEQNTILKILPILELLLYMRNKWNFIISKIKIIYFI